MPDKSATAHIVVSYDAVGGLYHVECHTSGDNDEAAENMANAMLAFLAQGRKTFIRCAPETASDVDHATQKTVHNGYVRFSFRDEPGEWEQVAEAPIEYIGFGAQNEERTA